MITDLVSAIASVRSPAVPVLHPFADPYLTVRRHTRSDRRRRPCEYTRQGGFPGHPDEMTRAVQARARQSRSVLMHDVEKAQMEV